MDGIWLRNALEEHVKDGNCRMRLLYLSEGLAQVVDCVFCISQFSSLQEVHQDFNLVVILS